MKLRNTSRRPKIEVAWSPGLAADPPDPLRRRRSQAAGRDSTADGATGMTGKNGRPAALGSRSWRAGAGWPRGAPRSGRATPADRFARLCSGVVARLPGGLAPVVASSMVGFAIINGGTFGVDLGLLTLLHGGFGWPLWLATSLSYLTAFGLSFGLNRALNFRSHAPVGRQTVRYVAAISVNYVVILLGVVGGLTALGLPYQVARIIAAAGEGVFMYCALRWVVFAERPAHVDDRVAVDEAADQPRTGDLVSCGDGPA